MAIKRVVITGLGVVAPNGIGKDAFWMALLQGRSGISRIVDFDVSHLPTQIAGQVKDFRPEQFIGIDRVGQMGRQTQFAIAAAYMALEDAGLGEHTLGERLERGRCCFIGTSNPSYDLIDQEILRKFFVNKGSGMGAPWAIRAIDPFSVSSSVAALSGNSDSALTFSTSCTAGLNSIGLAFREIRAGRFRLGLAGSADAAIIPSVFWSFCSAGVMSQRNDSPEEASRPFDRMRDGGILSEGAAVLVLEEFEHALLRGAHVYCDVLGYGETGLGVDPRKARLGMTNAMSHALASADLGPSDIDYICAHAPSDQISDILETEAIKDVFGDFAYRLAVSSIKSTIGNPQSAAGSLQTVASALAINHGLIPPTINYVYPDPRCDLDYVPGTPRRNEVSRALINAHGINGSDASLIVGRI